MMGRPSKYTPELGDLICGGIAEGKSLSKICESSKLPTSRTVYSWLRNHQEFLQNYEKAKEDQADKMVEEMLEICDAAQSDNVQVARLRVDTRKWAASKFKAKKYGDSSTLRHEGNIGVTDMSEEDLDSKIQQLEQLLEQSTKD